MSRHTYNRPRTRRRPPDFAPSSETPYFASSLDSERLRRASREATSGRPCSIECVGVESILWTGLMKVLS